MTDTTIVLTDEYLEAAAELREAQADKKAAEEREKHAKEILAKILAEGDTGVSPDGEMLVQVKRGARVFNEAEALKNWPASVLATVTRTVTKDEIDRDLAKEILPPAIWEMGCRTNKPSVVAL